MSYRDADPKRVYYLSMEFLMGRSLTNAVNNIGVVDQVRNPHDHDKIAFTRSVSIMEDFFKHMHGFHIAFFSSFACPRA